MRLSFLILSMALAATCPALAQQNAGPLNAAPGAPNQDPAQPNIATKTKTIVNKSETSGEAAIAACANLARGARCEMTGINSKKLKGRCRRVNPGSAVFSCHVR